MLRTVKGVEVNISGRTFSSRSFCHQPSALALSKKCPALTISYRPKLICKKRHGLDIHYSAAERSLGSHRRRRLRASSFPMPLTSNTQDSTRFPPHITALMRGYGESIISPISVRPTTSRAHPASKETRPGGHQIKKSVWWLPDHSYAGYGRGGFGVVASSNRSGWYVCSGVCRGQIALDQNQRRRCLGSCGRERESGRCSLPVVSVGCNREEFALAVTSVAGCRGVIGRFRAATGRGS